MGVLPLLPGGTGQYIVEDEQGLSWTDPPAANQFGRNQEENRVEGLSIVDLANRRV